MKSEEKSVVQVVAERLLPNQCSALYVEDCVNKEPTTPSDSKLTSPKKKQSHTKEKTICTRFREEYEAQFRLEDQSETEKADFLQSYQDFKDLALKCACTIITQSSLESCCQKFPQDPSIGGIAGGEKRVCFSCLRVKFPQKPARNMEVYQSPEKANKACKHELDGVNLIHHVLLRHRPSSHCFIAPPGCVVEYLGFRVFLYPDLPLDQCTLKVGKKGEDAMFPLFDPSIVHSLNSIFADQGLSPHGVKVGESVTQEDEYCVLPCDAEVYQLKDTTLTSTCYIIDTARVQIPRGRYPSDESSCNTSGLAASGGGKPKEKNTDYLSLHFRKEFVGKYFHDVGIGLSSDAFFSLSLPEDDQRVDDAEVYYRRATPQKVAEFLETLECAPLSEFLVLTAHFHGLNLRELGEVHNLLDPRSSWRQRIIVEVAARSFRRIVNKEWRWLVQRGVVAKQAIISVLVGFLNYVVGPSKDNPLENRKTIWRCMNAWKDECFPSLKDIKISRDDIVQRETKSLEIFLSVVSELLGVKWNEEPWCQKGGGWAFASKSEPFDCSLVRSVGPRIIEMTLVHNARSFVPVVPGTEKETINQLRQALSRDPRNSHLLNSLAEVYGELLKSQEAEPSEASSDYCVKQKYLTRLALEVSESA